MDTSNDTLGLAVILFLRQNALRCLRLRRGVLFSSSVSPEDVQESQHSLADTNQKGRALSLEFCFVPSKQHPSL
jgi:hypothetical protein